MFDKDNDFKVYENLENESGFSTEYKEDDQFKIFDNIQDNLKEFNVPVVSNQNEKDPVVREYGENLKQKADKQEEAKKQKKRKQAVAAQKVYRTSRDSGLVIAGLFLLFLLIFVALKVLSSDGFNYIFNVDKKTANISAYEDLRSEARDLMKQTSQDLDLSYNQVWGGDMTNTFLSVSQSEGWTDDAEFDAHISEVLEKDGQQYLRLIIRFNNPEKADTFDDVYIQSSIGGKDEYEYYSDLKFKDEGTYGICSDYSQDVFFCDVPVAPIWVNDDSVKMVISEIEYTKNGKRTYFNDPLEFSFETWKAFSDKSIKKTYDDVIFRYKKHTYSIDMAEFSSAVARFHIVYVPTYEEQKNGLSEKEHKKIQKEMASMGKKIKMTCSSAKSINGITKIEYNPQNPSLVETWIEFEGENYDRIETRLSLSLDDRTHKFYERKILTPEDCEKRKQAYVYNSISTNNTDEVFDIIYYNSDYRISLIRAFGNKDNPEIQFDVEYTNVCKTEYSDRIAVGYSIYDGTAEKNFETFAYRDSDHFNLYHLYINDIDKYINDDGTLNINIASVKSEGRNILYSDEIDVPCSIQMNRDVLREITTYNNKKVNNIKLNKDDISYNVELVKDSAESTLFKVEMEIPKEVIQQGGEGIKYYCENKSREIALNTEISADYGVYKMLPSEEQLLKYTGEVSPDENGRNMYTFYLEYEPMNLPKRTSINIYAGDDLGDGEEVGVIYLKK